MTRLTSKQRGVTLVEVMLTLAISAMLITTVLAGRNSVRSQAQFSDGMERIKESILSVKSEANTGNNTIGSGVGNPSAGNSNVYLTIGKSIHFSKTVNSNKSDTKFILCDSTSASGYVCGTKLSYPTEIQANITTALPWGIKFTGFTVAGTTTPVASNDLTIIYARDDNTGEFSGYWFGGAVSRGMAKGDVFKVQNQSKIVLNFASTDGRKGTVTVDPVSGTVTRSVL